MSIKEVLPELRNWREIPLFEGVTDSEWNDWHWQWKNRIEDVETLSKVVELSDEAKRGIQEALTRVRMAITPYYASLMDPHDESCPVRLQAIPRGQEARQMPWESVDPLDEEADSPVPGLTHRYPDRVLFLVTEQCSMYCRHCTRRRVVGVTDRVAPPERIEQGLQYIREHKEIRDVLISGGDPFTLSDDKVEFIVRKIREIPHVEIIRIGTRTPVVMPQRITEKLARMLAKYHPVYINTHFNHPKEITPESSRACAILADAGIPLGNQSVLLRGVNNCPFVMRELVQGLLRIRVKPYYIYQCDLTWGLEHFRTTIGEGLEIMEYLRGHTTGLAVPTYVVDAPGGGGKIPLSPQYILAMGKNTVVVRNYEGVISGYREPEYDPSENLDAGGKCRLCRSDHRDALGVAGLLAGEKVSLVPQGTKRLERRKDHHPSGEAGCVFTQE
ncbi:MAG: lysine 2,3-aminomutase [Candidatus Fermentithermobacillus carboniphilus]|uniref:L-lysine 2,3-aminomutase n=1 Tax=Candidatus Fermentithermobacillus carboniphilus TaxID=3085328 RepID=A0AAT9LG42_9FIRM|nr:MAG: lysine 2,3-aminomutase [Candidatus Fermentithermobacillus carboniphilus]